MENGNEKDLSIEGFNEAIDDLKLGMARIGSVNGDRIERISQGLMNADLEKNENMRAQLTKMSVDFLKVSENLCNPADFIERKFTA